MKKSFVTLEWSDVDDNNHTQKQEKGGEPMETDDVGSQDSDHENTLGWWSELLEFLQSIVVFVNKTTVFEQDHFSFIIGRSLFLEEDMVRSFTPRNESSNGRKNPISNYYNRDNYDNGSLMKLLIEENNIIQYQNNGLIHQKSFNKISELIDDLKKDDNIDIVYGGNYDDSKCFHIEPTIIKSDKLNHYVFKDEFFAPILSVYVYDPKDYDMVFAECIANNEYNLTGSIFGQDEKFILSAYEALRFNAGNFYINDKSTGSVVGRQPFGGFGKSGTNDKAGDINLLYRFMNQRNIKLNPSWIM